MKLLNLVVPVVCVSFLGCTSKTTITAPERTGWWIKIRKDKQQAPSITFFIGLSKDTSEPWKTWNTGESLEFDVPEKYKAVERLYVKAQSSGKLTSWFCMMNGPNGVKHFDFDDDNDHEEQRSDRDDECNFVNP